MKNILFILLIFISAPGIAGDGTLPVIRSISVEFIEKSELLRNAIPDCVNIKFNKIIKNAFKKTIKLSKADLEQTMHIQNFNGDLFVSTEARLISKNFLLKMNRLDLNANEFLSEFTLKESLFKQLIHINPNHIDASCVGL